MPQIDGLGFDPDALREKCRRERDERLRPLVGGVFGGLLAGARLREPSR